MGAASLIFGNAAVAILLSFLALNFTIVSFIGCEYVKLHFGPVNDLGIYFQNDEYFGLGLFRHQDFNTNKNSRIWEHDATCYDYTEIGSEMFRSTNLKSASNSFLVAVVFSAATLLVLLSLKYKGAQSKSMSITATVFSVLAFIFQLVTFMTATKSSADAVCSTDIYFDGWYEKYPPYEYPDVKYMKFFENCTLGSTGKVALAGIIVQAFATLFILCTTFTEAEADDELVVLIPPVSRGLSTSKMVAEKMVADEEAPDATLPGDERSDERSFVTNPSPRALEPLEPEPPLAPVTSPEPEPQAPVPEKFEDDISFAGEKEAEPVDDDLSVEAEIPAAPEAPATPPVPDRPQTPVRKAKTLDAGAF